MATEAQAGRRNRIEAGDGVAAELFSVASLAPPWVLMSCPPTSNPNGQSTLELYSIADGTSETVTSSPGVPQWTLTCSDMSRISRTDGVGVYWIRWDTGCYHCADITYFQNIQSGQLRDDLTNATTFADLNSPTLAHNTCPGVRLLRVDEGYGPGWGPLTPYGQFALAEGNGIFLERCGTHMLRRLAVGTRQTFRRFRRMPLALARSCGRQHPAD
jgi:hypothetical protein